MIVYKYDPLENKTHIVIDKRQHLIFEGKLEYKQVHEMFDTLVFEIIHPDPIVPVPLIEHEQED